MDPSNNGIEINLGEVTISKATGKLNESPENGNLSETPRACEKTNGDDGAKVTIENGQAYLENGDHVVSPSEFQTASPEKSDHVILAVTPKTEVEAEAEAKAEAEEAGILQPHAKLPKPEAPPGLHNSPPPSQNDDASDDQKFGASMPAIGKLIRERSNNFSAAFLKKLSSLKENNFAEEFSPKPDVTEFHLSGLKVTVKLKSQSEQQAQALKGRISFFSRSNCRDCTAVRSFFREKGLRFVEINIDVYPQREKELVERTGNSSVPQIFFNEKLFGGLVALNSLRNSGGFDQRLKEMIGSKCPDDAPASPVYGFDDLEDELMDQMIGIVRVLRLRLPIQDRLMKLKIVKNCFAGSELVEVLIQQLDCGRRQVHDPFDQILNFRYILLRGPS